LRWKEEIKTEEWKGFPKLHREDELVEREEKKYLLRKGIERLSFSNSEVILVL